MNHVLGQVESWVLTCSDIFVSSKISLAVSELSEPIAEATKADDRLLLFFLGSGSVDQWYFEFKINDEL